MSALQRLQADFQSFIMQGDTVSPPRVNGDDLAPAGQRLDVYYQAYRLRLTGVLREDFAGLAAMLGDGGFEELALAYIDACPSSHPSVRWFGQSLAGFLAADARWCARPELAEMAAFEWAWGQAFDAADTPVAGPAQLAALPAEAWAGLRLQTHSSLQRLPLHWNVPAFFGAVAREESLPGLQCSANAIHWVLWRRELMVYWRSLPADEAWALQAATAGASFAELCDGLCDWHDAQAVPARAAALLGQWLADGMLQTLQPGD